MAPPSLRPLKTQAPIPNRFLQSLQIKAQPFPHLPCGLATPAPTLGWGGTVWLSPRKSDLRLDSGSGPHRGDLKFWGVTSSFKETIERSSPRPLPHPTLGSTSSSGRWVEVDAVRGQGARGLPLSDRFPELQSLSRLRLPLPRAARQIGACALSGLPRSSFSPPTLSFFFPRPFPPSLLSLSPPSLLGAPPPSPPPRHFSPGNSGASSRPVH